MAFNPDQFASNLYKSGVAKTSMASVVIRPPRQLYGDVSVDGITQNDWFVATSNPVEVSESESTYGIHMRAEATDIPGRNTATIESFTYGVPTKVGYRSSYADVNMTFILSEDFRERVFFDRWMDLITGYHTTPYITTDQQKSQYDIGYLKNYVADELTITQADENDPEGWVYSMTLINAFPTIIMPLQANWQTVDIHKLQVTFSYEKYYLKSTARNHESAINHGNWLNTSGITGALTTGGGLLRNVLKSKTGI